MKIISRNFFRGLCGNVAFTAWDSMTQFLNTNMGRSPIPNISFVGQAI